MAEQTAKSIERLRNLIKKLVEKYEEAIYARNSYYTELTKLKKELLNAQDKIAEQEKRLEQFELKKAFASDDISKEKANKRIRKIIKEIDKCISLLNS